MSEQEQVKPKRHYSHRAIHSYLALAVLLIVAVCAGFGVTPDHASEVLTAAIWALAAIVISFIGGDCAAEAILSKRL